MRNGKWVKSLINPNSSMWVEDKHQEPLDNTNEEQPPLLPPGVAEDSPTPDQVQREYAEWEDSEHLMPTAVREAFQQREYADEKPNTNPDEETLLPPGVE